MGDVHTLRPVVPIGEQFVPVETYAEIGPHGLILARSMVGGASVLNVLLTNLPDGQGFEILASARETPGVREALALVANAVGLAALHLMPGPSL